MEKVENKLYKTKTELEQREQEVLLHQTILKDRCELLDNLKSKNISNELKVTKLWSDLEDKSKHIKLIESEITAKSDEIQKLVGLLDQKQAELDRRDDAFQNLQKQDDRNKKIKVIQSHRIEELQAQLNEANRKAANLEDSRKKYPSISSFNEKDTEFWKAQSKRIEQLENELSEANLRARTYEEVLKNINESRRLYLVEHQKQKNNINQSNIFE